MNGAIKLKPYVQNERDVNFVRPVVMDFPMKPRYIRVLNGGFSLADEVRPEP